MIDRRAGTLSICVVCSFFFFFLAAENSYGSTFFVAKYCIKIQYFGIDSMIFIEEKINSFIVKVCREL